MNAPRNLTFPRLSRRLTNLQLEDYFGILRVLILVAWFALGGMLLLDLRLRQDGDAAEAAFLAFSARYHSVLIEFALVTLMLTGLLISRDWYERVPRASAYRVRWLVGAVVAWLGLHYFAAFYASGGAHGPLLHLLSPLVLLSLLTLPGRSAWWLVAYLVLGHVAVALLERGGVLASPGPLAGAFVRPGAGPNWAALGVSLGLTMLVGGIASWRLERAGAALHRPPRLDPLTGLFRADFLEQRLARELRRASRQGGTTALLLLELDRFAEFTRQRGVAVATERLRQTARVLLNVVRLDSDTPARLAPTVFAVLLPAANVEGARAVAQRITEAVIQATSAEGDALGVRAGAAVVPQAQGVDPLAVLAAGTQALQQADARFRAAELRMLPVAPAQAAPSRP